MAVLSKTVSILTYSTDIRDQRLYVQVDPDTEVINRQVYVDIETYQDLGEPDVITVTIEPGDTLN
jgi:hypothetical protein